MKYCRTCRQMKNNIEFTNQTRILKRCHKCRNIRTKPKFLKDFKANKTTVKKWYFVIGS